MKTNIASSLIFLTLSSTSFAGWTIEDCEFIGKHSKVIMEARQLGVSVKKIVNKDTSEITKILVIEAYKEPRYSTKEYQNRAIEEFSNRFHVMCLGWIK